MGLEYCLVFLMVGIVVVTALEQGSWMKGIGAFLPLVAAFAAMGALRELPESIVILVGVLGLFLYVEGAGNKNRTYRKRGYRPRP